MICCVFPSRKTDRLAAATGIGRRVNNISLEYSIAERVGDLDNI